MKTTGYALRAALKQQELIRDTAAKNFEASLKKFEGEEKETPQAVVEAFTRAETTVAKLQTAQMFYNLAVKVEVLGTKMTLAESIKTVGGIARVEKMWRSATGGKAERYLFDSSGTRDPNLIQAKSQISPALATKLASAAAKQAGAFRAAIALANAVEVDIEDLDTSLFEDVS